MSYIVPRDKPKRCTRPKCRFMDRDTLDCRLQDKSWESFEEQYEHCPLIEVPTPHGRLIDADAHILEIRKQYCKDCSRRKGIKNGKMKFLYEIGGVVCRACEIEDMLNELDDAPTVIEAEE